MGNFSHSQTVTDIFLSVLSPASEINVQSDAGQVFPDLAIDRTTSLALKNVLLPSGHCGPMSF